MLKTLIIKNFAIIEDITLNFNDGMSALTGETGAGKSLIIDSISLLLGQRADLDMIRYGSDSSRIVGIFSSNEYLNNILKEMNINILEDITIEREITIQSKNKIKINNTSITLQMLKDFASNLALINSQNDTFKLFNKDNYLELIEKENDNKLNKLKNNYINNLYNYNLAYDTYNKVLKSQNDILKEKEFLEYNLSEIKDLNLEENIDIKLEDEINKMSHFDKIKKSLQESYLIMNDEKEVLDSIYNIKQALSQISSYDEKYNDFVNKLNDIYYNLEDISNEISLELNSIDYDEEDLNKKIEWLNSINRAKDKYKMSLSELISYYNDIKLKLDMEKNYDFVLEEKKKELINSFNILKDSALKLREYRTNISLDVEKAIISETLDLGLLNTSFKIEFKNIDLSDPFDKSVFLDNGIDEIDFLISFNKGEPLKPLSKVASGGEMSRVMLAFRSYFSNTSNISLLIFDEIDTGVDGDIAIKIAKKMKNISKNVQLLCITHLPSVAAISDNHYHIYKTEKDDRTYTNIELLDDKERIKEIASMLAGSRVSIYALDAAKELIEEFRK